MLDAASKYEMLDVTGLEGFITGDVMPVRDLRGDGSWRALRYEDLLFLREALLEREAVVTSAVLSENIAPPGRCLDRLAFNNAVEFWQGYLLSQDTSDSDGLRFIDKDATFAASTSYSTEQKSLVALVRGKTVDLLDASASGAGLSADCVRRAYVNTLRLVRTFMAVSPFEVVTTTKTDTTVREDGTRTSNTVSVRGAATLYATYPALRGSSSSVRCSFSYHDLPSSRWVSQSRWLYLIKVSRFDAGAVTPTDSSWLLLHRIGGNNRITAPSLENVARTGASYYGTYQEPYYCEGGGVEVSLVGMGVIVDHCFPADVTSLGWSWQPSP